MPTADTFRARGRRNGFPFCFPASETPSLSFKLDVSEESNVAPLTLQQAMTTHWLAYEWTFSASASITGAGSLNGQASATEMVLKTGGVDLPTPNERVCPPFFSNNSGNLDSDNLSRVAGESFWGNIVRMYDGPIENEDNFIGYGYPGRGSGFPKTPSAVAPFVRILATNGRLGGSTVEYELASYMTEDDFTDSREIRRHGTTNISVGDENIPFAYRCRASARDDPTTELTAGEDGGTATTNAVSGTTSASVSGLSLDIYTFA